MAKKRPHPAAGKAGSGKSSGGGAGKPAGGQDRAHVSTPARPTNTTDPEGALAMPAGYARAFPYLIGAGALLLLADLLVSKHRYFPIENVWGFYGLAGLVGGVVLMLAARLLAVTAVAAETHDDR
jgi:hypothetical protein